MFQTNIPWEENIPLPDKFHYYFLQKKVPFFPDEKEYYQTHASKQMLNDDPKGHIIVGYNPKNGKAAYGTSEEINTYYENRSLFEDDEDDEEEDQGKYFYFFREKLMLSSQQFDRPFALRKSGHKGQFFPYVAWQILNHHKEPYLVLRVYTYHLCFLTNREQADTMYENYRIIIRKDQIWEENREGIHKSQWGDGNVGWTKMLLFGKWLDAKPSDEALITTIGDCFLKPVSDVADEPYNFLSAYRAIPKKTFIYKNVPEEIRKDLMEKRFSIYAWPIGPYLGVQTKNRRDRIYIGKDQIYRFVWNPFAEQYYSATHARQLPYNPYYIKERILQLNPKWDYSALEGLAAMSCQLISAKEDIVKSIYVEQSDIWDLYDEQDIKWKCTYNTFVRTINNIHKYPCQEHLVKMGWIRTLYQFNTLDADEKKNFSLPEVLHVPGSALKHLDDQQDFRIVEMAYHQKEWNQLIERAKKRGNQPDMPSMYRLYMMTGTLTWQLFEYYVENDRPFQPFLSAILKQTADLRETIMTEYLDYLNMRTNILLAFPDVNLPMSLKPSEVHSKHDEAIALQREINNMRHIKNTKQIKELFKNKVAQKNYQDLAYENDQYIIMLPEVPEDLISEGAKLHHCVGSYIEAVAHGRTQIYFLRKKDAPMTPYCTIEVRQEETKYRMYQCFNAYDTHDKEKSRIRFVREWSSAKNIVIDCAI